MARVVRPLGRALLIALGCVSLRASPIAAQTASEYRSLVEEYATRDGPGAMAALARWSRPVVADAVNAWASKLTPQQSIAAAMLHTELASTSIDDTPSFAAFHISLASRLLDALIAADRRNERALAVKRRWYELVVSLYTSRALLAEAERFARDGLGTFPRDASLYVALGAIQELRVGLDHPDLRGVLDNSRPMSRLTRALESTAADFRRALALDGGLAAAHLHLGWIRFLLHDNRAADNFRAALALAANESERYLAHLFLGAVAERDNKLADARAEYEAAQAPGAGYQTPFVALVRVEEALGHHARARDIAQAYAALPTQVEDPWWDYHLGGLDLAALAWLRHEAQGR
jgi:hypothetical protein